MSPVVNPEVVADRSDELRTNTCQVCGSHGDITERATGNGLETEILCTTCGFRYIKKRNGE